MPRRPVRDREFVLEAMRKWKTGAKLQLEGISMFEEVIEGMTEEEFQFNMLGDVLSTLARGTLQNKEGTDTEQDSEDSDDENV